jgi:ABC-type phosphate transport system permease subunit
MGGLLVSTFLTLVLLPTTASLTEDILAAIGRLPSRALRPRRLRRAA